MSTIAIQGSIVDLPSGSTFRAIDSRVPCAVPPQQRVIRLTSDDPFVVSLDGLDFVSVLDLSSDNPLTVGLSSLAGDNQLVQVETITLISRASPYTGISLTRVAGRATTVRLIFGQAT